MKDKQQLTVGRLAKLAGLSPKSIRYYEQKKLIPEAVARWSAANPPISM